MNRLMIIAVAALMWPAWAAAGTDCSSYQSGSVTVTTCSPPKGGSTTCRSYRSGSVKRTTCN